MSKVNTAGSESILIKLDKEYFTLERVIILCFTYCVPANSSYQIRTQFDPLEDFEGKISTFDDTYDLICLGDYNSRTAQRPDYIVDDDNTDIPVVNNMCTADTVAIFPRGNMDPLPTYQFLWGKTAGVMSVCPPKNI